MQTEVTRQIDAPAEAVWDVLTDIPAAARTLTGVVAVEPLTPGPYAPGYRWRETRTMMGSSATVEMIVTVAEPPLRTEVVAEDAGTEYHSGFTVEPSADGAGCRVTAHFRSEATHAATVQRVTSMLFSPLIRASVRRSFGADLDDVAAEARRRTS